MAVHATPQTLKEKLGGRNIFLIGMMGSGKSQTGPILAKMINHAFVDTDDVIEKASKQSISSIFSFLYHFNSLNLEFVYLNQSQETYHFLSLSIHP